MKIRLLREMNNDATNKKALFIDTQSREYGTDHPSPDNAPPQDQEVSFQARIVRYR